MSSLGRVARRITLFQKGNSRFKALKSLKTACFILQHVHAHLCLCCHFSACHVELQQDLKFILFQGVKGWKMVLVLIAHTDMLMTKSIELNSTAYKYDLKLFKEISH